MGRMHLTRVLLGTVALVASAEHADSRPCPNPFRAVHEWAKPAEGREMGRVGDVDVDPQGKHIWAIVRYDPKVTHRRESIDSELDPVIKFDSQGDPVRSFGGGGLIWPHGTDIDPDGNIWFTDAIREAWTQPGKRGH